MKRLIFATAVLCCLLFISCERRTMVYVCEMGNEFHFQESCEWLDDCGIGVKKITLDEARRSKMKRCTNCGEFVYYEYHKVNITY